MVNVPPSHSMFSPCFCVLFLFSLNTFEMVNAPPSHSMLSPCFCVLFLYSLDSGCLHKLQITHMEMIKGIKGHGYYDELVVPIIDNQAHENQLTESFAKAVCFLLIVLHTCYIILGTRYDFHSSFSPNHMQHDLIFLFVPILQIEDYPKTTAVLVRNHGVFVWGDSWISAKTQVFVLHSPQEDCK